MSILGEINVLLADIQKDLDAIDLTKETDLGKIRKMGTVATTKVDEAVTREDFGDYQLTATLEMFKTASDKVGAYDKKQDIDAAVKNPSKMKEITDRKNAREGVKKSIQDKYQELSMKKAVIDKYAEKFNPEFLVERQNDKLEANKKKMQENKTRMSEISDFKNKVSGELGTIQTNSDWLKELEQLETLAKDVDTNQKALNEAKKQGDQDMIEAFENEFNARMDSLRKRTSEVTKKYKGVTLDATNTNTLKASIALARTIAESSIKTAESGIKNKAQASDKDFIKNDIYQRLDKAQSDKEFLKVLATAKKELVVENLTLDSQNARIGNNVSQMELGIKVKESGTVGVPIAEPTKEEIEELIRNDKSIRDLAPALTKETLQQQVYNSLADGHRGIFGRHPIAFLKSRFSKKAQETYMESYEKKMREEATKKIKEQRKAEAETNKQAAKTVDSKYAEFRKGLSAYVMGAEKADVEKMDKDAEKAPGAVLAEAYAQMPDDDEQVQ